jgi:hypothetical protein
MNQRNDLRRKILGNVVTDFREEVTNRGGASRNAAKAKDIDKFKAYCLAHSFCYAFAESDPAQAESIMRLSHKPALCPASRGFYIPHGYSWAKMSRRLKA